MSPCFFVIYIAIAFFAWSIIGEVYGRMPGIILTLILGFPENYSGIEGEV